MSRTATGSLRLSVVYDPEKTDLESLALALDTLLETALSTVGVLDEYGDPSFGEFCALGGPQQDPSDPWRLIYDDGRVLFLDKAGFLLMFDEFENLIEELSPGDEDYAVYRGLFSHIPEEPKP